MLEVGGATTVSGKPPYSASLASKITHIFVEKALEQDVQALQSVGVQCLSPDYIPELILQVRKHDYFLKFFFRYMYGEDHFKDDRVNCVLLGINTYTKLLLATVFSALLENLMRWLICINS